MEGLKKALANPVFFVVGYFIFMLATYILPYGGSNSAVIQGTAAGLNAPQAGHFQLLFWLHFGSILALCLLIWLRGSHVRKSWLVIFPVVAGVFDLTPGLSLIPLIPTALHICTLVMGARGSGAPAMPVSYGETSTMNTAEPPHVNGMNPAKYSATETTKIATAFCPDCGYAVGQTSRFCGECGQAL